MSLLTYDDARKYAARFKNNVSQRLMPRWHIDRTVGVQQFKNDRRLKSQDSRAAHTIIRRTWEVHLHAVSEEYKDSLMEMTIYFVARQHGGEPAQSGSESVDRLGRSHR